MISLDDIFRLLKNGASQTANHGGGSGPGATPLTPDGRAAVQQAAQAALAPKQSDESYFSIHPMGPDGVVLQHSEDWIHGQNGLKAFTNEVRVPTSTGELVKPKDLRLQCQTCHGYDSVATHCRCGAGICRRCIRPDPADGTSLCISCYLQALKAFDTWAAKDRQNNNGGRP